MDIETVKEIDYRLLIAQRSVKTAFEVSTKHPYIREKLLHLLSEIEAVRVIVGVQGLDP